jgi:hypothetical protein
MRETWYILEDGAVVDPSECSTDESGKLHHKSGVAVAMRGQVPSTRGVDPDEERGKTDAPKTREIKPENPRRNYRTRETRSES